MIGVTGANGYIGRSVLKELSVTGPAIAVGRSRDGDLLPANLLWRSMGANSPTPEIFEGCESIIHLAGLAHVKSNDVYDDAFDLANRQLSIDSALAAHKAGAKRFVFVSTMGVHGNWSEELVYADSKLQLATPYARSKWAAEQALEELCSALNMELCIVRPAMVYGHKSPGNFSRLLKLVEMGLPLPFASMTAKRSFTSVQNLSSFLIACATAELPKKSTFVFGDGSNWSTSELVKILASTMQRRLVLFPIPLAVLSKVADVLGRKREYDSLTKPMMIELETAWNACKWFPPLTPEKCLSMAVTPMP